MASFDRIGASKLKVPQPAGPLWCAAAAASSSRNSVRNRDWEHQPGVQTIVILQSRAVSNKLTKMQRMLVEMGSCEQSKESKKWVVLAI